MLVIEVRFTAGTPPQRIVVSSADELKARLHQLWAEENKVPVSYALVDATGHAVDAKQDGASV